MGLLGQPVPEGLAGIQHCPAGPGGLQVQRLDQSGQEPADLGIAGHEPFVERIPRRAHQRLHRAHVLLDPGAPGAELLQHRRQGGVIVEHVQQRAHAGMHRGDGLVVVPELAGAAFLPAMRRRALQIPENHIEDVDHVVACAAGEHVGVGRQGSDPPLRAQVSQLGGPGLVGVAGQRHDPRGRYPGQVQVTGAEGPDAVEPVQGAHQPGDRRRERRAAQQVQFGAALPFGHEQEFLQPGPQLRRRCSRQTAVDPVGSAFAHRGDQTREHALPGRQDPPGQQLPVGGAEQHRWGHLVGPGLSVQPGGEGEPAGLGGEFPVPVALPDLGGMAPPDRHATIGGQRAGVIDAELAGDRGHDWLGYRGRV